jgi:hypothetical protein
MCHTVIYGNDAIYAPRRHLWNGVIYATLRHLWNPRHLCAAPSSMERRHLCHAPSSMESASSMRRTVTYGRIGIYAQAGMNAHDGTDRGSRCGQPLRAAQVTLAA